MINQQIQRFHSTPQWAPVAQKLNEMVDALNSLLQLKGDEQFVIVKRGPGGVTLELNINNVLARIPKVGSNADESTPEDTGTTIGQVHQVVAQNKPGWRYFQAHP